jgi:hypothetical protein
MIPVDKDIFHWLEPFFCSFLCSKGNFIVYVIIEFIEASYCLYHLGSKENSFLQDFFHTLIEVRKSYSTLLVFFMGVDEKDQHKFDIKEIILYTMLKKD